MKELELRQRATCAVCQSGIGATGLPLFWVLTIERFGLDMQAIQRQQGLTMMLGGHAGIASVMGPDEDMAKPMMEPVKVSICESCAMRPVLVVALAEEGS